MLFRFLATFAVCLLPLSVFAQEVAPSTEDFPLRNNLQQRAAVSLNEKKLSEAVEELGTTFDCKIEIDEPGLKDHGIRPDEAVSLEHPQCTLQSALELLLDRLDLTYLVEKERLLITSQDFAETQMEGRRYAIGQAPPLEMRALLFTGTTGSWEEIDGAGAGKMDTSNAGFLDVIQTQQTHDQIGLLFAQVARVINPRQAPRPSVVEASEAAIAKNLAKTRYKGPKQETEVTLAEFLEELSTTYKIPVWLDHDSLSEEGISSEETITVSKGSTPLPALLEELLAPIDLTWMIAHESLVITTLVEAEEDQLVVRVYDVSRALRKGTPDQFLDALMSQEHFGAWADTGGNGEVNILANAFTVKQSAPAQRRIAVWISTLR